MQVAPAAMGHTAVAIKSAAAPLAAAAQVLGQSQTLVTPIEIDGNTYAMVVTSELSTNDGHFKNAREAFMRFMNSGEGGLDTYVEGEGPRGPARTWGSIKVLYR